MRRVHVVDAQERERVLDSLHCPMSGGSLSRADCERCLYHRGVGSLDARSSHVCCAYVLPDGEAPDGGVLGPPVDSLMTRSPVCVREDVGIDVLTALFVERGISGAPVVNEEGRPVGVVTITDLVKDRYEQLEAADTFTGALIGGRLLGLSVPEEARGSRTAGELMTAHILVIPEGRPVAEAAALMARHRIKRLPVVDAELRIIGILSSLDVMRWLGQQAGYAVD
jgi:CBS domain-containing protein